MSPEVGTKIRGGNALKPRPRKGFQEMFPPCMFPPRVADFPEFCSQLWPPVLSTIKKIIHKGRYGRNGRNKPVAAMGFAFPPSPEVGT